MKPFKFKEFSVLQDRCAMKIGTDGVLLGSWVTVDDNIQSILDIGTGTGVIALMLAQRSQAGIVDALEIDTDAYEQAVENFENSIWADRLFCYHASFQEFFAEIEEQYDLIVSNPPFYEPSYQKDASIDEARKKARFTDALPFDHLLYGASKLLSENGIFALVIPYDEEEVILNLAAQVNLFPRKITRVKGNPDSKIKRSLLEFVFDQNSFDTDELIIETARHQYTDKYIELTKDFYLKM